MLIKPTTYQYILLEKEIHFLINFARHYMYHTIRKQQIVRVHTF